MSKKLEETKRGLTSEADSPFNERETNNDTQTPSSFFFSEKERKKE